MKVRWREYEMICAIVIVIAQIVITLLKIYDPSYKEAISDIATEFKNNSTPLIFWKNILFPKISSILLMYLGYLTVNLLIIPAIKKTPFRGSENRAYIHLIKSLAVFGVVSLLFAIGANIICYYAQPFLYNYWEYPFLSVFGFNEKPLTNLLFGFGRATGMIGFALAVASVREFIIWLIEKPDSNREYRVMVLNTATALVFIYIAMLFVINPVRENLKVFLAYITPVLLLYIYNTYWLFPQKVKVASTQWFLISFTPSIIAHLCLSTLIASLPVVFIFGRDERPFPFYIFWLFLFFIFTPLCWLLYSLRKDKIAQFRNMETALAKSNADLQFLRSQINPHFLFNALNTLYGTALKDKSEHTAEGIQKLGDMMRFMLHENNLDFISMDKETEYLKNYIALQKLRTQSSQHILIADNIDEVRCNRSIAPMLLIPFVENAFKHGISQREKSHIRITLECSEKLISFEVRNSIHDKFEGDTERDKSGIGLKNVAERLKLLYPDKHELLINNDNTEFIVKLRIM